MARISVIIPCYNAAPYIAEAVTSVQEQTPQCPVDEIIVVDDGSTDASAAIVRTLECSVPVHLVQQANSGISEARNAGVRVSSGEWLAFLDADDIWPSGSLLPRAALLAQRADLSAASGMIEQFVSPDADAATHASVHIQDGAMQGRLIGALLVRRELFEEVGYFSSAYSVGETLDWVARIEAAGRTIGSVDAVVLRRRVHGNNSMRKSQQFKADYLSVLRAAIARKRARTDA